MSGVSWQMAGVLTALIVGHGAVILLAVKTMLNNSKTHTDSKFEDLDKKITTTNSESLRIERKLLTFQADLPKEYVRRDDWIRFSSVIDAKQDTISAEVRMLNGQMQQIANNMNKD